jgi:uncharacterized membrane protein
MHRGPQFIRTTIVGGIIFLIPLVFVAVVLGKAFSLMLVVARPVGKLIPIESVAGIALVNLIAVVAMLVFCFLAGVAARSAVGARLFQSVDNLLLMLVPKYALIKNRLTGSIGLDEGMSLQKPVLVRLDDQSQIAFEIERAEDGQVAVYLPGSPDPWSGAVVFVTADRVAPLNIGQSAAIKALRALGRGASDAL